MTDKQPMTDIPAEQCALRDRIAAVLRKLAAPGPRITYEEVADALLLELGLRLERGERSNPTGPLWGSNNRHHVTRWVTEWQTETPPPYCNQCGIPHTTPCLRENQ
jgi:hypothetical protein